MPKERNKAYEGDTKAICGNWTLLLMKRGIFPQTSNAEYSQKMVFGICSLTIVKFKRKSKMQKR